MPPVVYACSRPSSVATVSAARARRVQSARVPPSDVRRSPSSVDTEQSDSKNAAVKSPRPHICVCDAIYSNSINHVTMDQSGDVVRPIITLELIT